MMHSLAQTLLFVLIGSIGGEPRFDHQGAFVPHSILGSATEFASELKNNKMVC